MNALTTLAQAVTSTVVAEAKAPADVSAEFIRDAEGMAEGLTITFGDGDTLTLMMADLPNAMQYECQVHGAKQKLVDAGAIPRDTKTGKSATVADKKAAIREVYERLLTGLWNKPKVVVSASARQAAEDRLILIEAMARVTGRAPDMVVTFVDARKEEERIALLVSPELRDIVAAIRIERTKVNATIDTGSLLAGFMAADAAEADAA